MKNAYYNQQNEQKLASLSLSLSLFIFASRNSIRYNGQVTSYIDYSWIWTPAS